MLLMELNEYNSDLLRQLAARKRLRNLETVFNWRCTKTTTDDAYDSGFLEPWVQWVSVHTGTPASKHQIQHLGDVPGLSEEQLWERWSDNGRRSVVWGVMNGNRRNAKHCDVFIPDPWTFSEPAYPKKYQPLIELPRYLSKNYLEFSKRRVLLSGISFFGSLPALVRLTDLADAFKLLVRGMTKFGTAHVTFITFFEYLSAMAFLRAVEKYDPDDAIIFLNMFAHVQHHYWAQPSGEECPQLEFVATAIDEIFGKILERAPKALLDDICVLNALSQKCTHDEPAWILHRPKHPEKFIEYLGLNPVRVEPLMTHDAHLKFTSPEEADDACRQLSGVRINGKPMFFVEISEYDPTLVFYRLDFYDPVDETTEFIHGNRNSRFNDHFVSIVKRTGKHIQTGEVIFNHRDVPTSIYNHELKPYFSEEKVSAV